MHSGDRSTETEGIDDNEEGSAVSTAKPTVMWPEKLTLILSRDHGIRFRGMR